MNLQSDDFELFGMPRRFEQDAAQLDARWKELQRQAHPDRFAVQGAAAQRVAMQWSVRINEAYRRLQEPLARAAYLCELGGAPVQAEDNTAMPAAFLMQQMEWREALDDAASEQDVETLRASVRAAEQETFARCAHDIDQTQDFSAAAREVRALMFLARFALSVEQRAEQLGQ
jgi:molecular chaperone HscB